MKSVVVIMSSYNGEKFIAEQIESILKQKNVDVSLVIRDDGSTDKTFEIENKYAKNNKNIKVIKSNNVGFAKSFFEAMKLAGDGYDYYAFSDQDDVWENDKLIHAIDILEKRGERYRLYASGLKVVNENLEYQYMHSFDKIKIDYGSALSRQRLAGCTMVFNKQLYNLCVTFDMGNNKVGTMSHDGLVYYTCLLCGGKVYFDKEGKILYRRHSGTVTENGKGLMKKIGTVMNIFGKCKGLRYEQTRRLYKAYENELNQDTKPFVEEILNYKNSLTHMLKLFFDARINCGIAIADIVNHIAILMKCY